MCIKHIKYPSSILGDGLHYYYFEAIEGYNYGTHSIIQAGQGPYNISIAKTEISNFTVSIVEKFPISDFSINKKIVSVGEEIHFIFNGSEGNPPALFLWDFGDGSNSTERNPTHIYNLECNYTVSLTITDYDGDSDHVAKINLVSVRTNEPDNPKNPNIPGFPLIYLLSIFLIACISLIILNLKERGKIL